MTPGTLNVPIYKGAKWEHTLTFLQSGTEDPVDLTGLTPFVMQFENTKTRSLLAEATVTVSTPSNGVVVVSLSATQTDRFPLGQGTVSVGLRDAQNNPYIQATLDVKQFSVTPA